MIKKRVVIQLINTTMNKRKKMFGRWQKLTETRQMLEKCKRLHQIFASLNVCVKSVADNAFVLEKSSNLKEKALQKLISAYRSNLGQTFLRWR